MALKATDVAQQGIATLSPETPLMNAYRLFVDEQVSGAPVVDDMGRVVGVVSTSDLMRAVVEEHDSGRGQSDYLRGVLEFSAPDWQSLSEDFQDRLEEGVVADVMTEGPLTVDAGASLREVAGVMRDARVHRVVVVKEGYLVGIISALDVVGLVADGRADG